MLLFNKGIVNYSNILNKMRKLNMWVPIKVIRQPIAANAQHYMCFINISPNILRDTIEYRNILSYIGNHSDKIFKVPMLCCIYKMKFLTEATHALRQPKWQIFLQNILLQIY